MQCLSLVQDWAVGFSCAFWLPQPCFRLGRCFFLCFLIAPALFQAWVLVFLMVFAMPQPCFRLRRCRLRISKELRPRKARPAYSSIHIDHPVYKQIYVYIYMYTYRLREYTNTPCPGSRIRILNVFSAHASVQVWTQDLFLLRCFSPCVDSSFVFSLNCVMFQPRCGLKHVSFQADTSSYA